MRSVRQRGAVALLVVAAVVGACAPPPVGGGGGPLTLSAGHIDAVEVSLDGLALKLQVKDHTAGVTYRDPAQTVLHVKPESQTTVPSGSAFAFLGAPGTAFWNLPQTQNANLLWPGTSIERIGSGELLGNAVTWTIQSVSGPGGFHVYTVGSFGAPTVLFSTQSSFPQSRPLSVASHAHYNWSFGATGTYTLVMRANATLANGTPVASPNTSYTFKVGPL